MTDGLTDHSQLDGGTSDVVVNHHGTSFITPDGTHITDLGLVNPRVVYISGPMTGYVNYNFEEFFTLAGKVCTKHDVVVNPAQRTNAGWKYSDYLRNSLRMMLGAEMVVVMDGWEGSDGARLEVKVALSLGMPVIREKDYLSEKWNNLIDSVPPNPYADEVEAEAEAEGVEHSMELSGAGVE